jgi:hypothetical protein
VDGVGMEVKLISRFENQQTTLSFEGRGFSKFQELDKASFAKSFGAWQKFAFEEGRQPKFVLERDLSRRLLGEGLVRFSFERGHQQKFACERAL